MKFLYKITFLRKVAILGLLLTLIAQCGPSQATKEDLERVKRDFLQLRLNAALRPKLKNKSDDDLFHLSCRTNRVNCTQVKHLLKKEDPAFYRALIGKRK